MNVFQICILSAALAFCSFAGCGGSGRDLPDRIMVSGSVTFDSQPVKKGSIRFGSTEDINSGLIASADIKEGRYEIQVTPGKKNVMINSVDEIGSGIDTDFVELIPEKYNNNTELEATVGDESAEFDFALSE